MTERRLFRVAGGIVRDGEKVLLVKNRRRDGSHDWSTPGGVIDPGETPLQALSREVMEETEVSVTAWSSTRYRVVVDFDDRGLRLEAQVHEAQRFVGTLRVDDPDGVVVDARWVPTAEAAMVLTDAPEWVREPLCAALTGPEFAAEPPTEWRYQVSGPLGSHSVRRLAPG